jgi:hypothetical protein
MSFVYTVLVRLLIGVPVAFLVLMAFVWVVDRVFGKTETVLELVQQKKLDAAERDLWDRLAVGVDEWLP